MTDNPKIPPANITALSDASYRVSVAVAEFKGGVSLQGSMRTIPWEQAFALAVVGSSVREVPGSTYTSARLVFDSAQRISNAWYFEPESINRSLKALERKGLIQWPPDGLQAVLTPRAEAMLLAASMVLEAADES